nr:uncharacterized protein LOC125630983 [Caretta caretta]
MPSCARRSPVWSNGEVLDLISVWREEAVQSQLCSSYRNYDTFGQIPRDMMERGYDWDTQQCGVKVKELQNAYRKARKANSRSGGASATCRFYKELDAILGSDPTSTPRTTMDTSEPSSTRQGEEEEEDTPESLDACSQELFSSQEEDATLRSELSVLSWAERLQRLRKRPRKSKEDMLQEVMQQSPKENQKVQEWRESKSRIRQENAVHRQQSTELRQQSTDWLISIMERQADSIQTLEAIQAECYHAHRPLQPLSQNSLPCVPMSSPTHFPQHPGSYHHQLPPVPVASPPSSENYDPYPLRSAPLTMHYNHPEVQHSLHSTPDRKAEYDNRTDANLS